MMGVPSFFAALFTAIARKSVFVAASQTAPTTIACPGSCGQTPKIYLKAYLCVHAIFAQIAVRMGPNPNPIRPEITNVISPFGGCAS